MNSNAVAMKIMGVSKKYGGAAALDDVSLEIRQGEFLTLLGASGSGKSTLLKIIAGSEYADAGRIELFGVDIAPLPPKRRGIGMVFQNYALFPHMTVDQNIEYPLKRRKMTKVQRADRLREMRSLVRLDDFGDRYPSQLSGGQQQRVALARALAFSPKLLLMDEPLGALDRQLKVEMRAEISRIHADLGTTVVFVTHDQEEALALSDRIAILDHGKLVALDTPQQLFETPKDSFVARFLSGSTIIPVDVLSVREGTASVELWNRSMAVPVRDLAVEAGPAELAVRPHSFVVTDDGTGWPGRVQRASYVGEEVELLIASDEYGEVVIRGHAGSLSAVRRSDDVTFDIVPQNVSLLPG